MEPVSRLRIRVMIKSTARQQRKSKSAPRIELNEHRFNRRAEKRSRVSASRWHRLIVTRGRWKTNQRKNCESSIVVDRCRSTLPVVGRSRHCYGINSRTSRGKRKALGRELHESHKLHDWRCLSE